MCSDWDADGRFMFPFGITSKKRKAENDLTGETEKKQKTEATKKEHLWLLYDREAGPENDILHRFTWTQPGNDPIGDHWIIHRAWLLPPQIQSYIRIALHPDLILDKFSPFEGVQIRKMLDELPGTGMHVKDIQNIILGYVAAPKLARFRFPVEQMGVSTVELYDEKGALMSFEPEDPKTDVIVYYDPGLLCDSSELPK